MKPARYCVPIVPAATNTAPVNNPFIPPSDDGLRLRRRLKRLRFARATTIGLRRRRVCRCLLVRRRGAGLALARVVRRVVLRLLRAAILLLFFRRGFATSCRNDGLWAFTMRAIVLPFLCFGLVTRSGQLDRSSQWSWPPLFQHKKRSVTSIDDSTLIDLSTAQRVRDHGSALVIHT